MLFLFHTFTLLTLAVSSLCLLQQFAFSWQKKLSKNNRPSNIKVTCWALFLFGLIVVVNAVHNAVNIVLDVPFGRISEGCVNQSQGKPEKVFLINSLMHLAVNI